jgi:AraC-like DNA-binding protein
MQHRSAHIQDVNQHSIIRSSRPLGWKELNVEHRIESFAGSTDVPQGVVEYGVFFFPKAGTGTFTVNGHSEKTAYASSSFCLFPPGVPLRWDRTSATELTLISISTKKVAEICHDLGHSVQNITIPLTPKVHSVLTPLVATINCIVIHPELRPPTIVVDHIHDAFVGQLLGLNLCSDAQRMPAYRASEQRLRQAIDFMMGHLDVDIGLAQIAQAACMSKYHFARTFGNAFGVSPARWLTNARMNHAAQILKNKRNTQSIDSIASSVGFASSPSFDRAFKRCYGVNPMQFRHTPQ